MPSRFCAIFALLLVLVALNGFREDPLVLFSDEEIRCAIPLSNAGLSSSPLYTGLLPFISFFGLHPLYLVLSTVRICTPCAGSIFILGALAVLVYTRYLEFDNLNVVARKP